MEAPKREQNGLMLNAKKSQWSRMRHTKRCSKGVTPGALGRNIREREIKREYIGRKSVNG
jgi:hypothetical protein